MEWEIADLEDKFFVDLTEREGKVTISSVTVNGNTHEFPEIRISKIGKNSTISLETESGTRPAHVKKIEGKWWIHLEGEVYVVNEVEKGGKTSESAGGLSAPMPGTILEVMVKEGQRVREGQPLMTMEAMKMEHVLEAPRDGVVAAVHAGEGATVDDGLLLVEIETEADIEK